MNDFSVIVFHYKIHYKSKLYTLSKEQEVRCEVVQIEIVKQINYYFYSVTFSRAEVGEINAGPKLINFILCVIWIGKH